jgi:hypothetical protein
MPTEIPTVHSIEHDFSAIHEANRSVNSRSKARVIVAIGAAALAAGAGVGLGAWGLSHLVEPKIVTTERVVIQKEIEKVEIEKPVITERLITVEKPVIVERQVQVPVPQAAPQIAPPKVGDKTSDADFQRNPEFQSAAFNGRITSIVNGEIKFSNGRTLYLLDANGAPVHRPTTSALNGKLAYCAQSGTFPNGKPRWPCQMNMNGTVVNMLDELNTVTKGTVYRGAYDDADDPFAGLFN